MKKCSKCQISYTGNLKRCPLCQGELIGKKTLSPYPKLPKTKESMLYKILLFISIDISIIFAFIEYNLNKQLIITKYLILGMITIDILVLYTIKKYKNVPKKLNKYFIIILFLTFLWYIITKSLIITTYIVPLICITILLINSITMLVLKDSYLNQFLGLLLFDCVIGIIPGLLILLNLTTTKIISYTSLLLDGLILIGLLIFCHDKVLEELTKRFNI